MFMHPGPNAVRTDTITTELIECLIRVFHSAAKQILPDVANRRCAFFFSCCEVLELLEALRSIETSGSVNPATQCNNPYDQNP